MRDRLSAASGLAAPARGVCRPRRGALRRLVSIAPLALGCSNGAADQVTAPVAVGMTSAIAPYYADGQITLYQVSTPVTLPVRKPSSGDESALGKAPTGTPYARSPFLLASDESVEIHFVLSNVDAVSHNVWLLIDPWNEFVRWKPGVTVVNDEQTIPNNGYDKQYVLAPMSRTEGTITSDDTREIAVKLASVQNFLASPQAKETGSAAAAEAATPTQICNNIFDYQNRSNSSPSDPFYTPWIPPVVAGLTGFDLGLRMEADQVGSAGGAGNVAIEITIEVHDLRGDRFVPQDAADAKMGPPSQTLSPPAARF